jgi:hypothetical protein
MFVIGSMSKENASPPAFSLPLSALPDLTRDLEGGNGWTATRRT